jgi:ribosomal protein S12 methylthiotransferase accessory factor
MIVPSLAVAFEDASLVAFWKPRIEQVGLPIATADHAPLHIARDLLDQSLAEVNRRAHSERRSWLLIVHSSVSISFGPLFRPGTACWECMAVRIRAWRRFQALLAARLAPSPQPSTTVSPWTEAAQSLFEEAIAALVDPLDSTFNERMVAVDLASGKRSTHYVSRQPRCAVCGTAEPRATVSRVELRGIPIRREPTGYRSMPAEDTLRACLKQLSPVTGVIDELTPLGNWQGATGIHIVGGGHNFSFVRHEALLASEAILSRAGGKGTTPLQAYVSAMCETIERYSGVFHGDEPVVQATQGELEGAIDPNTCMLFSECQYAERDTLNRGARTKERVPKPFEPDRPMAWSPVWSLTSHAHRYLPTAYCYYGHDETFSLDFCRADSNGAAAGNCLEEAVLQGTLELVERDCVALWWFNQLRRPGVDLTSIDAPFIADTCRYYASIGRTLEVLDLTNDLGIPTFAAISASTERPTEDILYGFSAHLDPAIAVVRAILEVNQSLVLTHRKNRDGSSRYARADEGAVAWWSTVTRATHPYLTPDPALPAKMLAAPPAIHTLAEAVQHCVDALSARGIELLVLDQSRADTSLHAAKMFAPGLRHFWNRFAPGRLYAVPVELGWLQAPLPEAALNGHRIYF